MKEVKGAARVVGVVLLALFVLFVGLPLVLAAAGVVLGGIGMLFGIAVALIKLAVVAAVIYLLLTFVRAMLR